MTFACRVAPTVLAGVALALLAGCSEKPQTEAGRRSDQKAWVGTRDGYQVAGWRAGDESSWDQQMRNRALNQNEYLRTLPSPAVASVTAATAPAAVSASAPTSMETSTASAASPSTAASSVPVAVPTAASVPASAPASAAR